ncbi:MAG TPA: copper oxidase [Nitrospira sp.]|nr:copper oxidase [Nitrospira sp.]
MRLTRREAVGLAGFGAAAAVLSPGSTLAQMGHEGHDMGSNPTSQPSAPDQVKGASDWMSVAKGTVHPARTIEPGEDVPPGEPGKDYTPVITPNGATLPFRIVDGIKVFHLVAEEVMHEFASGLKAMLWGFNGRVHGPTIEAVEGDHIRIYVTNKLPAPTSIHWHGIILPSGMDGVGGLSQKVIQPGETFKYEYPLVQHGTHMYHSHHDEMIQMALGVMGLMVIHPRRPAEPRPDRDFAFMLSEWDIKPGAFRPDPRVFAGFNTLTLNAKAFPGTEALVAKRGDRVRLRLVNLSAMDHHPIHLHGHAFWVTQTDGGMIPPTARWPETTILVPVGSSRTVDFVADNPGDWAMHCHMTHHVMNQMGHEGPNMIGVDARRLNREIRPVIPAYMTMGEAGMGDHAEHAMHMAIPANSIPMVGANGPYDYITMGGMFTILKVRENLTSYADPGWYRPPPGTLAQLAGKQDLKRDGIKV